MKSPRLNLFLLFLIICIGVTIVHHIYDGYNQVTIPNFLFTSSYQEDRGGGCRQQIEDTEFVEENFATMSQFDRRLIAYVRTKYVIPPSKRHVPYNLDKKPEDTYLSQLVRKVFRNKTNGIFIEAGADDGDAYTHTIALESDLNWTGLLVECNPTRVEKLKTKKRKAWVAAVCISKTGHPAVSEYAQPAHWSFSGTLNSALTRPQHEKSGGIWKNWTSFDVETVPFYSILAAVGFKEIDFFSFDVEGSEFDILQAFPFHKVLIKFIVLEVQFISLERKRELEKFMEGNGYKRYGDIEKFDHYYAHKSIESQIDPDFKSP